MSSFNEELFVPVAQVILPAAFAWRIVQALRDSEPIERHVVMGLIGFLSLTFYREYLNTIATLSAGLTNYVTHSGGTNPNSLGEALLEALRKAASGLPQVGRFFKDPLTEISKASIGDVVEAFKGGVWGTLTLVIELLFLLAGPILKASAECLTALVRVFLPIVCAIAPISDRPLRGMMIYAIEVALWTPLLSVVKEVLAIVSKRHLEAAQLLKGEFDDFGLSMIAVQVVAVFLILRIPRLTQMLFAGGLSADLGMTTSAGQSHLQMGSRFISSVLPFRRFMQIAIVSTFAGFACVGSSAIAAVPDSHSMLRLTPGYVYKLICRGRLLVSSVGNPNLVELQALPHEIGCAALVRPQSAQGRTNLLLETSTGSIRRIIEIGPSTLKPSESDLTVVLQGTGDSQ